MQLRKKLAALAVTAGAASLVLAGGPAGASTHPVRPAWTTGREVVHGALYGRAAWIQAGKKNPRVPVRFRGIVRTRGVVGLGSTKSRTHSIRTPDGWFTVRQVSSHSSQKVVNKAICRLQFTLTGTVVMRPRHSTGVFAGATGRGRVRLRFTFNYPRRASGACNYSNSAVPSRHGGLITFRLVMPALTVR
jgi:hypothetical protein